MSVILLKKLRKYSPEWLPDKVRFEHSYKTFSGQKVVAEITIDFETISRLIIKKAWKNQATGVATAMGRGVICRIVSGGPGPQYISSMEEL